MEQQRVRRQVGLQRKQAEQSATPEDTRIDLFEQTTREIEERRQFLDQMRELGQEKQYEANILREIKEKIKVLKQIDQARVVDDDAGYYQRHR